MRQQAQPGREKAGALRVHEMVHPDVVFGDVLLGLAGGASDREVDLRRDALGESLRQPRLGPLPARPALSFGESLLECRQREVQEHGERELVGEEVVGDVRRGVVTCQRFVEGIDLPQVEVRLLAEVASDLVHVPVQRLERELHPVKQGIQSLRVAGEIRLDEAFEGRRVAVLRPPELADLLQSPREPRASLLAVFRAELLLEPGARLLHPGGRRRGASRRLLGSGGGHGGQEDNREQKGLLHRLCILSRRREYRRQPATASGPPPSVGTRRLAVTG